MRAARPFRQLLVLALTLLCVGVTQSAAQVTLYSVANNAGGNDDQLRVVDPATGMTLSSVTMTLAGQTVLRSNGLAAHPLTGELWVVLTLQGVPGRTLGRVDPATGVVTAVGNMSDQFAGIAFDCSGNLYGVTGDGGVVSESLFSINQATGAATLIGALGNGGPGEAIAFNPVDQLMYHSSGEGVGNVIFESFDPTTPPFAPANIPVGGTALENGEAFALTFEPSTGAFLWSSGFNVMELYRVTTAGGVTFIGTMDHMAKGLALTGPGASGCPVDLAITKTDAPDPVNVGSNVTYSIDASNVGMTSAGGVMLSDSLPTGTTFFSLTAAAGWTCTTPAVGATGSVSCSHPNFLAGAMDAFTLVVGTNAAAVPMIVNTATIASAEADSSPADNTATATTTVNPVADLSLAKTDSPDPVAVGANLTYTIDLTNNGPSAATNVSLSDPMPANTTFVSATAPAGWTLTTPAVGANGTITASNASLAAGAMASFTVVVQPTAAAGGTTLSNTATVTATETDANAADNSASASTTVQSGAATDFSIATTSPTTLVLTVKPGVPGTFMVRLTPIPAGSTFGAQVDVTCSTSPFVGTCTGGTVPAGTGQIDVPITVTPTIFGSAPPLGGSPLLWIWVAALATALIAVGVYGRRRVARLSYAVTLGAGLLVVSAAMLQSACAGSTGQKLQGPYQVTVTATSGGISHSTSATYNVSK